MKNKYPVLRLFYADCNADGCGEGYFDVDTKDEYSIRKYQRAMNIVERYMNYEGGWRFSGLSSYDLLHSEKEAQKLFSLCKKEFQDANILVKLSHSMHGRILFDRIIEFPKHQNSEIADLINTMTTWNFIKKREITSEKLKYYFDGR